MNTTRLPVDLCRNTSSKNLVEIRSEVKQEIIGSHRHLIATSHTPQPLITGKESPRHAAFSTVSSIEESEPSSPTNGPPINFAEVIPGIFRSSFPKPGNFDFIESLGLKTILTLVAEEYPLEFQDFVNVHGIEHIRIPIPANKDAFDSIPPQSMALALEVLQDKAYHPVLVHCNKGKHRTGCVVGCYRKMNDWTMESIIEEYRKYAGIKARPLDEKFIDLFNEHMMMMRLENMELRRAVARQTLITPPSSVKDDNKEEGVPNVIDGKKWMMKFGDTNTE